MGTSWLGISHRVIIGHHSRLIRLSLPRWGYNLACEGWGGNHGFDHCVGHCGVLHMTAESMRSACLRCLGLPSRNWEGQRHDPSPISLQQNLL
jgi:hypothetical protein